MSYGFGIKRQLTVEGHIKPKYLNICIGQTIIQEKIKWTIGIVTKYHSKPYNLNKLGKGLLGDATFQLSRL